MDYSNFKFSRVATELEIADFKKVTLDSLDNQERNSGRPAEPNIAPELISYLMLIRDNPEVPATKRDRQAGILIKKGSRFRKQLLKLGLVVETDVSPGGWGKNFKNLSITPKGQAILHREIEEV